MKVLYILHATGMAGATISFLNMLRGMREKGVEAVVASHNEGFGRMTAEAAFCGCLVIGRNTSGTKEIMEKTGELPFLNNEEMVEAMMRVAEMKEKEYRQMADKAQWVAVEMYSNESNVEQIYKLYENIMKIEYIDKRRPNSGLTLIWGGKSSAERLEIGVEREDYSLAA